METLPMAPSRCSLDEPGLSAQLDRYHTVGASSRLLEHSSRRIVIRVEGDTDRELAELIAVERECCPFFELDWDADGRRFSVGVADAEHEPALDAIACALGVSS